MGAPELPSLVAYVRAGDIYVSRDGSGEKRLTSTGGHARPRWSPDGGSLAFVRGGQLWTMRADGSGARRLSSRAAAGPSWSPDGKWLAFASLSCTGGPGVYRIRAAGDETGTGGEAGTGNETGTGSKTGAGDETGNGSKTGAGDRTATGDKAGTGDAPVNKGKTPDGDPAGDGVEPEVLFPRDCRGEELPLATPPTARKAGATLNERLATDDAVAWSPDGKRMAFRGGDCESTYDACLTIGTIADGAEQTVAAYGGGSLQNRGFAVVPSWRADGAKLSWTAFQEGETAAESKPLHLVEYDTVSGAKRILGGALDRELAYVDATRAVITGQNGGRSWVTVLGLTDGSRTPFRSGSQPSVQPVPHR
ncbi:TolB family protein [Actinoplanes sp. G11-F43]|uniref:TolB family protein n=1 Tax=Actinoplanes sp. G11-F43 TaxID=3424130 RepID=UPI003D34309B